VERLMLRRLADWLGYAGVLALVAAIVLPLARAQWNPARPWVFAAGAALVLASILLRLDYGRRVTRYGLNSAVLVILVIGVIAFVEAISYRHNARLDLTENRRHSLSPQTIQLLRGLTTDVVATAFYRTDQPGKKVAEDLLKQYASYSGGKLTWKMTDPDREPGLARRYGVESYGTIVLETPNRSEKVLDAEEEKLTNGLVKATREGRRTVYVLTGHGELEVGNTDRQGFSEARAAMERSNYDVKELMLARQGTVPEDAAVVILPGPRTDLFTPELDALEAYLDKGGKLFVMANPFQSAGLTGWLARHGFELENDLVIESSPLGQLFGIGPEVPIVQQYEPHPITRDLRGLTTLFPLTRSLKPGPPGGKYHVQTLALTSPQSWGETDKAALDRGEAKPDPGDPRGPLAVAAVGTADKARIVVFGTAHLASNQFLNIQGNRDLFLNTVSWLAEEEDLISIRPKDAKQTPVMLTSHQHQFVFLVPVVLVPAVTLLAGVVVFVRRRAAQ
jgi:ABC-type uncharacterized transport system involved in gliding motility auxiliary subunit